MTTHTITIDANVFTGDDEGREPVAIELRARAYRPAGWAVPLSPTEFAVKNLIVVEIDPDEPTIELEDTGTGDWCWHVGVHHPDVEQAWERFFYLTADANFLDLVDLNPSTLDPAIDPGPPWLAALAAAVDDIEEQIAAVEAGDVDSVAGLSGTVTAAGLQAALGLPADTIAELLELDALIDLEEAARILADITLHTTITGETDAAIAAAIDDLIDSAPGALDTLKELADALGDDPNFAATVTAALAGKVANTRTVNGHPLSADVTVTKGDVGLGSVDNTADADKPVSTPQAAALSGKATSAQGAKADTAVQSSALALPSYLSGPRANPFDARFNVYNLKPANTRKLRAGLARAMAGGISEWIVAGDSEGAGCTDGVGLTYDRTRAWPIAMRDELARHGIPVGGCGLIGPVDGSALDSRWAKTGAWNDGGKWYSFVSANGATRTLTSPVAGDRVSVLYFDFNDGATFTVHVNGASQGTITSASPAGLKVATFSAAIAAGQTVLITKTSAGGIVDVVGAQVWSNANGGLIVHNLSKSGATASGTGALAWVDNDATTDLGALLATKVTTTGAVTPDAFLVALGGNDHPVSGASIATITAALTTLKSRFASSDFVLVAPTPLVTSVVSTANWNAYVAALYDLADTLDVPLVDFRARMGDYDTIVANGLSTDGQGHLIAGANAALGRNLGMLLAS